jgi:hypothetical protein
VVLGDCIAVGERQEVTPPERGTNELVVYNPLEQAVPSSQDGEVRFAP